MWPSPFTAELVLRAVTSILGHEPDDTAGQEYTLSMLNTGLAQYGMRAEQVPDSQAIKSYVTKRDGHS